jgi:hypothetical protein
MVSLNRNGSIITRGEVAEWVEMYNATYGYSTCTSARLCPVGCDYVYASMPGGKEEESFTFCEFAEHIVSL